MVAQELVEYFQSLKDTPPTLAEAVPHVCASGWKEEDVREAYYAVFGTPSEAVESVASVETVRPVESVASVEEVVPAQEAVPGMIVHGLSMDADPRAEVALEKKAPKNTNLVFIGVGIAILSFVVVLSGLWLLSGRQDEDDGRITEAFVVPPEGEVVQDSFNQGLVDALYARQNYNCYVGWPGVGADGKGYRSEEECVAYYECERPLFEALERTLSAEDKDMLLNALNSDPYTYENSASDYIYDFPRLLETVLSDGGYVMSEILESVDQDQVSSCKAPYIVESVSDSKESLRELLYDTALRNECGSAEDVQVWGAMNARACWDAIHCVADTLIANVTDEQAEEIRDTVSSHGTAGRWDETLLDYEPTYGDIFTEFVYPTCGFE